jgi:hypothetical protein
MGEREGRIKKEKEKQGLFFQVEKSSEKRYGDVDRAVGR